MYCALCLGVRRIFEMRSTRLMLHGGQVEKTDQLRLKEISSSITTISIVVIYAVINAPDVCVTTLQAVLTYLSPTSSWIYALINIHLFLSVCEQNIEIYFVYNSDTRHMPKVADWQWNLRGCRAIGS